MGEKTFKGTLLATVPVSARFGVSIVTKAVSSLSQAALKSNKNTMSIVVNPEAICLKGGKGEDFYRLHLDDLSFAHLIEAKKLVCIIETQGSQSTCFILEVKSKAKELLRFINATFPHLNDPSFQNGDNDKTLEQKAAESALFEARYLGSVPVTKRRGDDVCMQALQYLGSQQDLSSGAVGNSTTLLVSAEGLRTLDALTRVVIQNLFIKTLSYATVLMEGTPQEIFACISYDDRLQRACCYLYNCGVNQGGNICEQISKAAEVAKLLEESGQFSPFDTVCQTSDCNNEFDPIILQREINRDHLACVKTLGMGQYGAIYLATYCQEDDEGREDVGIQVAVKKLHSAANETERADFLRDPIMSMNISHENVLKLVGVCMPEEPWLLVHEFALYGNLHDVLLACRERQLSIGFPERVYMAQQVATGMDFLISKNLLHMDVAARNVFLHSNNVAKIANFSTARNFDAGTKHYVLKHRLKLSLRWLAIETYTQNPKIFSEASDVWSFAVFLWEILSYGATPFAKLRLNQVHQMVPQGTRLPKPEECPEEFFGVMMKCWSVSPAERPKFAELKVLLKKFYEGKDLKDTGEILNAQLTEMLTKLSVSATTRRRSSMSAAQPSERKASSVQTLEEKALGVQAVKRFNPLFGQSIEEGEEGSIEGLDEVEEDQPEEEAQDDSGPIQWEPPSFSLPPGAFVAGDINGRPAAPPPNAPPMIKLGGDNRYLSGKSKLNLLPSNVNEQPAAQKVLMMPKDLADMGRPELLKKRPSKTSLAVDNTIFVPGEGDE